MNSKLYCVCLWVFLSSVPAFVNAQNTGRLFHAYAGLDFVNTATVNKWMPADLGYPAMQNHLLGIGIDGYAVRNNFMIGGLVQVKHGPVVRGPGGNLRPYIVDLMAQGGYVLFHREGLLIYSTLGVGYGAFATHIFNTRKKYPEFIPSEPAIRENVVLIQKGIVGSLSVGADYFVGHHDMNRSQGFAVGLRIGYDARPMSNKWQASQYAITGGPSYAASGAFVRLTVGKGNIGFK